MKNSVVFVLFLFFISSCFAQEIVFQRENYSPLETIIGSLDNSISELNSNDIKIYEGRREVFFEKGLIKFNQTYYLYIIPTKEGEFSLEINNLLYNNSGLISSININRNFSVAQSNDSIGFGVRPGVYEGQSPEVVITNLKNERTNITINNKSIEFNTLESKKVSLEVIDGFSMYKIGNYNVPIIKFSYITNDKNNTSPENNSITNEFYENCIKFNMLPFFSTTKGEISNYSLDIQNNCSNNLTKLMLISTSPEIVFQNNNFTLAKDETKTINFTLIKQEVGEFLENISLIKQENKIANIQINIYCFSNKTNLENFTQTSDSSVQQNCSSSNGNFCEDDEQCNTENIFYDYTANRMCCLSECTNLNERKINWMNIFMAILGIAVIAVVAYLLFKRSKNFRTPRIEDRFKEVTKKYEKSISGNKK